MTPRPHGLIPHESQMFLWKSKKQKESIPGPSEHFSDFSIFSEWRFCQKWSKMGKNGSKSSKIGPKNGPEGKNQSTSLGHISEDIGWRHLKPAIPDSLIPNLSGK